MPSLVPDIDLVRIKVYSILVFSCVFEGKPVSSGFCDKLFLLDCPSPAFVMYISKYKRDCQEEEKTYMTKFHGLFYGAGKIVLNITNSRINK